MQGEFYHLQLRLARDEQGALKELYTILYKKLVHFAHLLVRSRELSEEVVEDVFIKLWTRRKQAPDIQNLKVYLYVTTKNTALNYLSKKASELTTAPFDFLDIDLVTIDPSPEQQMITAEMLKKVEEAVESLPPRCKMIFKLIREDGLKYKEVADILGISVNTIDAQLAIAIKRIGAALLIAPSAKMSRKIFF